MRSSGEVTGGSGARDRGGPRVAWTSRGDSPRFRGPFELDIVAGPPSPETAVKKNADLSHRNRGKTRRLRAKLKAKPSLE